jgi:DNA-directed RNA polymerase I subunit RPA43
VLAYGVQACSVLSQYSVHERRCASAGELHQKLGGWIVVDPPKIPHLLTKKKSCASHSKRSLSMELEKSSASQEARQKPSHKTKKRKHEDSELRASSKKRKYRDENSGNVPITPTRTSKSKTKSKPVKYALQSSSPSSLPAPILLEAESEAEAEADHDISLTDATPLAKGTTTATSSPFHLTTLSLYLPLPAIALSRTTALPSLLTTHLAPLLLTYFPPLRGIILSVSDPVLSSKKPLPDKPPPPSAPTEAAPARTVLAHCADTDGLSYVWLTATFLVLRPSIGDELEGWVNVCSEGFVGLVCYNYFQVAVARDRIPDAWRWVPPDGESSKRKGKVKKGEKKRGKKNDEEEEEGWAGTSQETLVNGDGERGVEEIEEEGESGHFRREDGTRVKGSIKFRVVDCEIVPGVDRGSWSLQIDGTLLSPEEEERVLEEERQKTLRKQGKVLMSGGMGSVPRNGSVSGSRLSTPT